MGLFSSPKIYTVHINPNQPHAGEKPIFIREGFNIIAFLFGVFWALYNRMWLEAFVIFAVLFSISLAREYHNLDEITAGILQFSVNILIGFQANDLRRANLAKRGYIMSDIVVSDNELRAQQRYFERALTV